MSGGQFLRIELVKLRLLPYTPNGMGCLFEPPFQLEQRTRVTMAETTKLSVEKALEKLRGSDPPKSKNARHDEKIDALDEEIKRMRAQRLRLDQRQRKRD